MINSTMIRENNQTYTWSLIQTKLDCFYLVELSQVLLSCSVPKTSTLRVQLYPSGVIPGAAISYQQPAACTEGLVRKPWSSRPELKQQLGLIASCSHLQNLHSVTTLHYLQWLSQAVLSAWCYMAVITWMHQSSKWWLMNSLLLCYTLLSLTRCPW